MMARLALVRLVVREASRHFSALPALTRGFGPRVRSLFVELFNELYNAHVIKYMGELL